MGEPIHVPLLDLGAQNQPLDAELKAAFARQLESSQFILGPEAVSYTHLTLPTILLV